jgi:hypothetical protein
MDECPARHKDLYLTSHNTHTNPKSQQTSGHLSYTLDRAATGNSSRNFTLNIDLGINTIIIIIIIIIIIE